MTNSTEAPAVLGPVERQVRPTAWWRPQGEVTADGAEKFGPDELVANGWVPLYDQAAMDTFLALSRLQQIDELRAELAAMRAEAARQGRA